MNTEEEKPSHSKGKNRSRSGSSRFLHSNFHYRRQRSKVYTPYNLWSTTQQHWRHVVAYYNRNAESQLPFHIYWIRICFWPDFQVIPMHIKVLRERKCDAIFKNTQGVFEIETQINILKSERNKGLPLNQGCFESCWQLPLSLQR